MGVQIYNQAQAKSAMVCSVKIKTQTKLHMCVSVHISNDLTNYRENQTNGASKESTARISFRSGGGGKEPAPTNSSASPPQYLCVPILFT